MATSKSQRAGIWVIAIVMTVGTLGAFFLPLIANDNASQDALDQQAQLDQVYEQMRSEAKVNNLPLEGYTAEPFAADSVTSLVKEDLVVGDGAEATRDTKNTLAYFGWTPAGAIFDSSNKKDGSGQSFGFKPSENGAIQGWVDGVVGMKVGGVRKLTIPADQAYGTQGSLPLIDPNMPLTFIMKLEKVE